MGAWYLSRSMLLTASNAVHLLDLEKQQHAFASGEIEKTLPDASTSASNEMAGSWLATEAKEE